MAFRRRTAVAAGSFVLSADHLGRAHRFLGDQDKVPEAVAETDVSENSEWKEKLMLLRLKMPFDDLCILLTFHFLKILNIL